MLTTAKPLIFVVVVWALNVLIIRRGVHSIEAVTKVFVPLMWIFMAILIVRGVTLPNGTQGVYLLFTPNFEVMKDPAVWQGAFSQIFFTLSLGFGTMVAYASYLPKNSDLVGNSFVTSFLNCGFEYLAGLAVFSVLFAFAIVPQASTLSMMFFIVPQGIAQMPAGVQLFGIVFFLLLLIAGLTSSVSLIEGIVSAMRDKFGWARGKTVAIAAGIGVIGSCMFALPQVVNPGLEDNGTIGLTLLDLIDHWVFSYGLLAIGLAQCILVGWVLGADKIRAYINENSSTRIGPWFDVQIKFVIPAALTFILGYSLYNEFQNGLYGMDYNENYREGAGFMRAAPVAVLMVWFLTSTIVAFLLTKRGNYAQDS